jgi:hypothetical protein
MRRLSMLLLLVSTALAATFVVADPAFASGPPRAQFWVDSFSGDKLDKDVTSSGAGFETDLSKLGRDCWVFGCFNNWNNVISSIDTTGGGQPGAYVVVWTDANLQGSCLLIPPGKKVADLRHFWARSWWTGDVYSPTFWNDNISSFAVYQFYPWDSVAYCDTYYAG